MESVTVQCIMVRAWLTPTSLLLIMSSVMALMGTKNYFLKMIFFMILLLDTIHFFEFIKRCINNKSVFVCRIYYQKDTFIVVPHSCAGVFGDPNLNALSSDMLTNCPALSSLVTNFISTDCPASFADICEAEYTNNPPFSCANTYKQDILTTLGTHFILLLIIIYLFIYYFFYRCILW